MRTDRSVVVRWENGRSNNPTAQDAEEDRRGDWTEAGDSVRLGRFSASIRLCISTFRHFEDVAHCAHELYELRVLGGVFI